MWNIFMGALQELYNWNIYEQTEVDRISIDISSSWEDFVRLYLSIFI